MREPDDHDPADPHAIAVVGGGLSGLVAAHLLEARGLPVLLLEARERLGGRILGAEAAAEAPHPFDLGPAWVWPAINPRLAHWVRQLGLSLFEQHAAGATVVELPGRPVQRQAQGYVQEPRSMRLQGGTVALVRALRAGLPRSRVLTGTRVQALALQDAGDGPAVVVDAVRGGLPLRLHARAVVLAMPPRLLAATLQWQPALPPARLQQWAATPTWMAGQAKVLAVYAAPFWRAQGLSGTAMSRVGPMVEVHDASDAEGRHAALFGFVGVPAALRQRAGEAALKEAAVQQLVRLFGPAAATPLSVHLQDWAFEPHTATAADVEAGAGEGHPVAPAGDLPEPWRGHVHLAGSEFAADFTGYLEGAVLAAEQAVHALLAGR